MLRTKGNVTQWRGVTQAGGPGAAGRQFRPPKPVRSRGFRGFAFDPDGHAVEAGRAAQGVHEGLVGEVVEADAGTGARHAQPRARPLVAPAVGEADDTRPHLVALFERGEHRSGPGRDAHALAVAKPARPRVVRM